MKRIALIFSILWLFSPLSGQMPGLEILNGRNRVEIPFTVHGNFILVDIQLQGAIPLKFIFDTGAENTILFERLFTDILGTEYDREISIYGADYSRKISALIARGVRFKLDENKKFQSDLIVLKENTYKLNEFIGMEIHGILGSNIFCGLKLELDYQKRKITLYPPSKTSKTPKGYSALDLEIHRCKPYIIGRTQTFGHEEKDLKYLIDTGAGLSVLFHIDTDSILTLPTNHIAGSLGSGMGGLLSGYLARIQKFNLGEFEFVNMVSSFQYLEAEALAALANERHGIIGNIILNRFKVIIDYSNSKLLLKPTRDYKKPIKVDRSGIFLMATGTDLNTFVVQHVIPNSAADEAGVVSGDIIRRLNIWPSYLLELDDIVKAFQKREGKKVKLRVLRDGERLKKQLILRDII